MTNVNVKIDCEELLHLAMQSSRTGKHEEAIVLLKRALLERPDFAPAWYLLGTEHAQIGLYDRAKAEIGKALEIDPGLNAARFQLGLLFLTSGEAGPALDALAPLSASTDHEPFSSFAKGLEFLVRDEFSECRNALKRGIALNKTNEPLNDDMRKILDAIADKADATPAHSDEGPAERNLWLSAYRSEGDA